MADLPGRMRGAEHDGVAEQQRRAHAHRHLDEQRVGGAAAVEAFGEQRAVRVVTHRDRQSEAFLECRAQRHAGPAEVARVDDGAMAVHDAGDRDADAEHLAGRLGEQPGDHAGDPFGIGLPGVVHRQFGGGQRDANQVEHGAAHEIRLRQVDGDDGPVGGVHADQRAAFAAPRRGFLAAGLPEDAVVDEVGDDLGDRHAAQSGHPSDLGARKRVRGEQQTEHRQPVAHAHVRRVGALRGGHQRHQRRADVPAVHGGCGHVVSLACWCPPSLAVARKGGVVVVSDLIVETLGTLINKQLYPRTVCRHAVRGGRERAHRQFVSEVDRRGEGG